MQRPESQSNPTWDPTQYLTFADHRLRPALELLARVPVSDPAHVVDLGCGAGNVTRFLRERWSNAEIVGIDSSKEMLERARQADSSVQWRLADMAAWRPDRPVDVLYSNAALHWLEDHEALFPRLMQTVAPGGALAVQMPRNFGEPSHTSMYDVARDGPWADRLVPLLRPPPVSDPRIYYDLLQPHCTGLDVWETRYVQVLTGEHAVAEFTKGSWLRPMLEALEEPQRSEFESAYRVRVGAAYPPRADGTTLFPFQRLFIVATR